MNLVEFRKINIFKPTNEIQQFSEENSYAYMQPYTNIFIVTWRSDSSLFEKCQGIERMILWGKHLKWLILGQKWPQENNLFQKWVCTQKAHIIAQYFQF